MRGVSLPNGHEISYALRHAFFANAKQLQRHDSVNLSSVSTDYSFSSHTDALSCTWRKQKMTKQLV